MTEQNHEKFMKASKAYQDNVKKLEEMAEFFSKYETEARRNGKKGVVIPREEIQALVDKLGKIPASLVNDFKTMTDVVKNERERKKKTYGP
jgi:uncharacterized protein (DUF885 family)